MFMSVELSLPFASGMVLQREMPIRLTGRADEDEAVTITFQGQRYRAEPDADGNWQAELPPLSVGGPFEMHVNELVLQDVYVGDVWLCSGQSNMQLTMARVRYMYPEAWEETVPAIRGLTVAQRTNFQEPCANVESGSWQGLAPDTVDGFSAVGLFFAKRLYRQYGVPIGLLQCAVGGTPIHAWMSRNSLEAFPDLLEIARHYEDAAYAAGLQEQESASISRFFEEIDATDAGLPQRWFSEDFDDSLWDERPLLTPWEGSGSVWLRKTLDIPEAMAGKPATLFLGTLKDWDCVYLGGEPIGNTTYRYPPREYGISALPAGRCTLAIRAISKEQGGFTPGKQYLLSTSAGCLNLNGLWRFHRGGIGTPHMTENPPHNQPTGLYHGMLAPLQAYPIRGALWYQGESDTGNPENYAQKLSAMILDWRKSWGYDFPFLFVELAHWAEGAHWHLLRGQQWEALASTPGTAMAAGEDTGEFNDLHPQNKQIIGERLARCAMRLAYDEALPPSPFEMIYGG